METVGCFWRLRNRYFREVEEEIGSGIPGFCRRSLTRVEEEPSRKNVSGRSVLGSKATIPFAIHGGLMLGTNPLAGWVFRGGGPDPFSFGICWKSTHCKV